MCTILARSTLLLYSPGNYYANNKRTLVYITILRPVKACHLGTISQRCIPTDRAAQYSVVFPIVAVARQASYRNCDFSRRIHRAATNNRGETSLPTQLGAGVWVKCARKYICTSRAIRRARECSQFGPSTAQSLYTVRERRRHVKSLMDVPCVVVQCFAPPSSRTALSSCSSRPPSIARDDAAASSSSSVLRNRDNDTP